MDKIETIIGDYIAENILFTGGHYPYPLTTSFLQEGIVDSMNVLELVSFVESRFGLAVEDQDIVPENFDSVSRLAAFVCGKLPAAALEQL